MSLLHNLEDPDLENTGSHTSVAILLATYNGGAFLREQLASYEAQHHGNWYVWASDDGSTDRTLEILAEYQERWGKRMTVVAGPHQGFVANFLSLVCRPEINADYYAYSDQDDLWEPEKLTRAVAWLSMVPPSIPALYCARTRLVDEQGRDRGFSPLMRRPPSFANALMQNIAGGNTMVFNAAACALLRSVEPGVEVVTFDWWTYLVVTGCGGRSTLRSHSYLTLPSAWAESGGGQYQLVETLGSSGLHVEATLCSLDRHSCACIAEFGALLDA